MPRGQKSQGCKLEGDPQPQGEAPGLVGEQVPVEEEEEAPTNASLSSAMIQATPSEVPAEEIVSCPQSPQRAFSPTISMASLLLSLPDEASTRRKVQGLLPQEDLEDLESFLEEALDEKMADLVQFLLRKYRRKEPSTKAEMLDAVIRNYLDHFPDIFRRACECLQLVFGIDVKEVGPPGHSYVLVTALGLTYDGMQSDGQGMPKAGLLIIMLCIIFIQGNRASERAVWQGLSVMGVYAGRDHYIFGNPKKFITKDLVQEQYLEYRRVPDSDRACYEFLWGPRAHAETTKMKVLKYWAQFSGSDPRSFQFLYAEALRDELERARARDVVRATRGRGRRRSRARKRSRATSRSSSGAM